jgi:hypothetical protein
MKRLITNLSLTSHNFIPLRSKYSTQHLAALHIFNLCPLNARDYALQPYRKTGKIKHMCAHTVKFLHFLTADIKMKGSGLNVKQALPKFRFLLILQWK